MDMICVINLWLAWPWTFRSQAMLNNSKAVNKIETNFCVQIRKIVQTKRTAIQVQVFRIMNRSYIKCVCVSLGLCVQNQFDVIYSRVTNGLNKKELAHQTDKAFQRCSYTSTIALIIYALICEPCLIQSYFINAQWIVINIRMPSHFTGDKMMR